VGGPCQAPAALPLGRSPSTDCTGGWVGPRPIWMGVEKRKSLAWTKVQTPNCAAHSKSLYQLHCPDPSQVIKPSDLFWNTDVVNVKVRDVRHHSFLTSALDGGDWSVSCFNSKVVHAISQAVGWLMTTKVQAQFQGILWGYVVASLVWGRFFLSTLHFPFLLSFCQF
jgi:hypothetical protein